ncbi:MAG: uroporphyrinogen-III synthase [Acidobacteriota bacterium]|nr:uroporphyrinogen-III synthase [Acidobacteriota bacterium]
METTEESTERLQALRGWRILVSRAKEQAGGLSEGLRQRGAAVLEIPFIEIRPPRSYKAMDESLKLVNEYEWLLLTSANGVRAMFERVRALNLPRRLFKDVQVMAIGSATRKAAESEGLKVALMPKEYVAESVVEALADRVRGKRVLLCRAKIARDVIPRELRRLGACLDVVEAYETVMPQASRVELRAALRDPARRPHLITFTSASTVKNYMALLGIRSGKSRLVQGVGNASIGPVTSDTLRKHELSVDVAATEYNVAGLIRAMEEYAAAHTEIVSGELSLPVI